MILKKKLSENSFSEELWLFQYDELDFRVVTLQNISININKMNLRLFDANIDTFAVLNDPEKTMNEDDEGAKSIFAKCELGIEYNYGISTPFYLFTFQLFPRSY